MKPFEDGLLATLRSKSPDILQSIGSTRDLTDETAAKLKAAVDAFAASFA